MSDRIGVFNRGRLEQIGPVEELYERPRTRFVAEFIGETNMIAGKGRRRADAGYSVLETADGPICAGARKRRSAAGSPAALSIRPERIRLEAADAQAAGVNRLTGTDRGSDLHGSRPQVRGRDGIGRAG